jgi:hypothetical protein
MTISDVMARPDSPVMAGPDSPVMAGPDSPVMAGPDPAIYRGTALIMIAQSACTAEALCQTARFRTPVPQS